jgi:beta-galactosidase
MAIPTISFKGSAAVLANLPIAKINATPLTFEDLQQPYGFVLYRSTVQGGKSGVLKIKDLRDYGIVLVNGKRVGVMDRRLDQDSLQISLPPGNVTLDLLVENMGRINFGKYLLQNKKGITEKVMFRGSEIKNWKMYGLPFANLNGIKYQPSSGKGDAPVIKKGAFVLKMVADTYLDMRQWGKGMVWVNGHNLGKYWRIGPQQTLYLPAEWLKKGNNEIEVLELLKPAQNKLQAIDMPILNQLQ